MTALKSRLQRVAGGDRAGAANLDLGRIGVADILNVRGRFHRSFETIEFAKGGGSAHQAPFGQHGERQEALKVQW